MSASLPARECLAAALVLAAALALHTCSSVPPGRRRWLLAGPTVLAFLLMPLLFDHQGEAAQVLSATNFSWQGTTLVSLCMGRAGHQQLRVRAVAAGCSLPGTRR